MPDDLTPELEADLVRYADGTLDAERSRALEARLADDPALTSALDQQRRARTIVHAAAAETFAPQSLRLALDAQASKPPQRQRRRWFPALSFGGATALAAVVAVLLFGGGGGLTVQDAVAAATRPSQGQTQPDPKVPKLLAQQVDGVPFPNYVALFGFAANGTRTDKLDGHQTRTVFYSKGSLRVAYTIIDGKALDQPKGTKVTQEGIRLISLTAKGRNVVTWQRHGHTCVLSGEGVDLQTLLTLASWHAKGAVTF